MMRRTVQWFRAWMMGCRFRGVVCALLSVAVCHAVTSDDARADLIGHGGMVRALAVSPDGQRVLSGSFDFSAILWDFGDQSEIAVLDGHDGPVNDVSFFGDSAHAVSASDDGTAILWNLEDPTNPQQVFRLRGHGFKVMAVAVQAEASLIATGGWDKTVRLWDARTGEALAVIDLPSPVNALAFVTGGDGPLIAIGGHDGPVRLWHVGRGVMVGALNGHAMGITRLAASPDGVRLLSAGIDGQVRLWDVAAKAVQRVFEFHDKQVFSVAFGPDGASAISSGRDGFLVHWALDEDAPLRRIAAHDALIWASGITPNGQFAISASSDESVRIWHLATGDRIGPQPIEDDRPQPWLESDHPGAKIFTKCARCHSLSADGVRRSGPHFDGLFGRRAGSVAGYNYSAALHGLDFKWGADTIATLFTLGPDVFVPGTKMPIQRVTSSVDLTNLVDYLRLITNAPQAE